MVVGANKVVKDIEAARKRQQEYCLALESARVRVAYGIPASSINNTIEINGANPFAAPGRFIVVIVEESLGF